MGLGLECFMTAVSAACMLLTALLAAPSPVLAETVQNVAHHMDKSQYTSVDIKEYLKELKGKEVSLNGSVNEVRPGRRGTKIEVSVPLSGRSKKFVVDVITPKGVESRFHKHENVSCRGKFLRYNSFTLNGIVVEGSCTK